MSNIHLKYNSSSAFTNNQVIKYNTSESGATTSIIYDSGTNVGIGTSTPTARLHVSGNAFIEGDVNILGDVNIVGTATTINTQTLQTADNKILLNYSGTNLTSIGGGISILSGKTDGQSTELITDVYGDWNSNVGLHITGRTADSNFNCLTVSNSANTKMLVVRNDGKVSVNKTPSSTTLDVQGDTTNTLFKLNNSNFLFSDKLKVENVGSFYSSSINSFGGYGSGTFITDHLDYNLNTSYSTYLAFSNLQGTGNKSSYGVIGGNIGSADSDYKLVVINSDTSTVSGSVIKVISNGSSSANDGFDYYNYGVNINSNGVTTNTGVGNFYKIGLNVNVSNGDVNYAALFNGGNVGIGTSTPTARLDVSGATGYNQLRARTSYTPSSSGDTNGNIGDIAWDNNYIYVKTNTGWGRSTLDYSF